MEGWEEWQREYRFGVLLIFPPDPVRTIVNELRRRYDPRSHSYCTAHISLTVPATNAIDADQWRILERVASQWEPVVIEYGPLKVYEGHNGVTLAIEPGAKLDLLRQELEAVSPFANAPPRRWPFSPHMTIAEFVTMEQRQEIVQALEGRDLRGSFKCQWLSYALPDMAFRFTERRRLFLGGDTRGD